MKLNDMLYNLLDLAKEESEPNRYAHSEEYNKLYDELDIKTLIIDELEKQLGCPLEVRCKVVCDSHIYDENGIEYKVIYVYEDHFDCEDPFDNDMGYTKICAFDWKNYKKTWWLKEDKKE